MRPAQLAALVLFLSAMPAAAEVAVVSGGTVKLGTFGSVDPVCHPLGGATVHVIEQPQGGALLVSSVQDYPNFPTFNPHAICNTRKVPQTRVSYQASAGFVGMDSAAVELVFPEGNVRRLRFAISVREAALPPTVLPPLTPYVSSPVAQRCSTEADRLDLHGVERRDFRAGCKQRLSAVTGEARPRHAVVRHVDPAIKQAASPPPVHKPPTKPAHPPTPSLAI
jgi:hypothetical protein